jgi:hypothetical protein
VLSAFPPKVFVIGAQKSGTTQLASLLGQHPDICLARSKEPDIFSGRWCQGLDSFQSEFARLDRICLDASTSYSCACLPRYFSQDIGVESGFNGVPERIHSVSPDARFIYIMRDPVARAFFGYWHEVRAGRETRPFEIAVRQTTYFLRTSHYFGQIELYSHHINHPDVYWNKKHDEVSISVYGHLDDEACHETELAIRCTFNPR